ncbi:hypothetical protein ABPG72_006979 [Tetrahymena utriculariae]
MTRSEKAFKLQQILRHHQDMPINLIVQLTGYSYSTVRRKIKRNQPNSPPVKSPGRQPYFSDIRETYNYLQEKEIKLEFGDRKFAGRLQADLIKKFSNPKISKKYCYYLIEQIKAYQDQLEQGYSIPYSSESSLFENQKSYPQDETLLLSSNHTNTQQNNQLNQPQQTNNNLDNQNEQSFEIANDNFSESLEFPIETNYYHQVQIDEFNNNQSSFYSPQNDLNSFCQNNFSFDSQQYEAYQNENQLEQCFDKSQNSQFFGNHEERGVYRRY